MASFTASRGKLRRHRALGLASLCIVVGAPRVAAQGEPPVIAAVEPAEIGAGATITVTGSSFGAKPKLTATLDLPTGKVAKGDVQGPRALDTRIVAQLKKAKFGAIGA